MKFSLVIFLVALSGCSFQMGMSTPRGYYTKEEMDVVIGAQSKAISQIAEYLKKQEDGKKESEKK